MHGFSPRFTAASTDFTFEPLKPFEPIDDSACGGPAPRPARSPVEILQAAESEAERIREDARRDGFATGHAAGLEQAREELESAGRALAEALRDALRRADELAAELEREAVDLALAVAEKVVAGAVEERPERVLDVVTGALRGLVDRRRATILVHPGDAELVREQIDAIAAELGGVEHCDVQPEIRVGRGGAVVRTPKGELDMRLDVRLRRAGEVLHEVPA
jgi:flagellar assembly protein FliH